MPRHVELFLYIFFGLFGFALLIIGYVIGSEHPLPAYVNQPCNPRIEVCR